MFQFVKNWRLRRLNEKLSAQVARRETFENHVKQPDVDFGSLLFAPRIIGNMVMIENELRRKIARLS